MIILIGTTEMSPSVTWVRFRSRVAIGAALAWVLASSVARAEEADDRYTVAAGHYAQGRWELAAEEFQAFVDKHGQHPKASQAVFFLGEALIQLGRLDDAAEHFRDYLKRKPGGRYARPALFRAGEAAYLAGKLDLAEDELQRFLAAYPDDELNAYVLPYLGDVALSQDQAAKAEDCYRRGLDDFSQGPRQDECRFGLARALEKQGNTQEAERFYLAVAAKPASPLADDAQFGLGTLHYGLGRHEKALAAFDAFESRLAESPWQSTARLGRGWALLKLGRTEQAETLFESIQSDPKVGVEARYWLGLAQKARKDWQAAAQTLLKTASDFPDHKLIPALRFHAGDALIRAGDAAAAARLFDQVLATAPPDNEWIDDATRGSVEAALRAKEYERLDHQAAEFARRFPQSPLETDVRRMLARSLVERRQHERAMEILRPLVAAGKEPRQAPEDQFLLATAYEGLNRHQEALDTLLPVLSSATGRLRTDAQLTQASLLTRLERFDEAIVVLEPLLAANPMADRAVKGLGNLAICYAETRQFDEAKKRYAELLEQRPDDAVLEPATEQLADLAYDAGDLSWASELFTRLAEHGRSSACKHRGLSGLAWSQHQAGRLEDAAATFDRLLTGEADPALAAEAALARGRILEQLRQLDPAVAMYDLVIDRYPKSAQFPQALFRAALLRDTLEQDQEAAALYERLAREDPQFARIDAVLYHWAWALDDLGRRQESLATFERIHDAHPKSSYWADATFRLAQRAFEAKEYQRAGRLLGGVLAADPTADIEQNALYLEGQIAAAEGKWDEARRSFETLLANHPKTSLRLMAEYAAAEAVFRQQDFDAAADRLDRLARQARARRDPWTAVIPLRLAQAWCHQKRWNEAYQIASRIGDDYPDFEEQYEVDYVVGRCLSARAEFERARQSYREVIRSPAGSKTETAAKAQLMIAESYYHQKDYQTALREYLALEILYDYPTWQAAAVFQAAKCYEMLDQWKQATDQYVRLLQVYPDTTFTRQAAERLQTARQRVETEAAS